MEKNEVLLLLLLHCTAVTVSQNCTHEGIVEIIGVETDTLLAGRLEICLEGQLFAVYDMGWGEDEAEVVCREKGFDDGSSCGGSCFGASELTQGCQRFECSNDENALNECSEDRENRPECSPRSRSNNNAGVICWNEEVLDVLQDIVSDIVSLCGPISLPTRTLTSVLTPSCLTPTTPPQATPTPCDCNTSCPSPTTQSATISNCATPTQFNHTPTTSSCTMTHNMKLDRLLAVLGALSAILFFALIGMVTGWMWSCHQSKKSVKQSRRAADSLSNPNYALITSTSTVGPQDTPTTSHAPSPREEEQLGEQREAQAYEVPVQSNQRYEMASTIPYNKLQHY